MSVESRCRNTCIDGVNLVRDARKGLADEAILGELSVRDWWVNNLPVIRSLPATPSGNDCSFVFLNPTTAYESSCILPLPALASAYGCDNEFVALTGRPGLHFSVAFVVV